ncbi:MAG: amino acid ABC transporter substrate-binding protein [Succinivibrio sp.]|nr:amino acid ABC transporter substrate-binding protein [Succinivibrio sp.]
MKRCWSYVLTVAACLTVQLCPGMAGATALVVATEQYFPPYVFQDEDGTMRGFNVDLLAEMSRINDWQVVYELMDFGDIIPAVREGRAQMGMSAFGMTLERRELIAFSEPYLTTGLALAINEVYADSISSFEDANGRAICVEKGTTSEVLSRRLGKAKVLSFDDTESALRAFNAGECPVLLNDDCLIGYALKQGLLEEALELPLHDIAKPQQIGMVFAHESTELVDKFNAALSQLRGNGVYAELYARWFGQAQ